MSKKMNVDNDGKRIIKNLMMQLDNPHLSVVEEACEYLGHPFDVSDVYHRCYCRAIIPGDTVKVVVSYEFKENSIASKSSKMGMGFTVPDTRGQLLSRVIFDEPIEFNSGDSIEIIINLPDDPSTDENNNDENPPTLP